MLVKGLRISGLKSCEQFFDIFYNLLRRNIAMKVVEGGWVETLSDGVAIWEFM